MDVVFACKLSCERSSGRRVLFARALASVEEIRLFWSTRIILVTYLLRLFPQLKRNFAMHLLLEESHRLARRARRWSL